MDVAQMGSVQMSRDVAVEILRIEKDRQMIVAGRGMGESWMDLVLRAKGFVDGVLSGPDNEEKLSILREIQE